MGKGLGQRVLAALAGRRFRFCRRRLAGGRPPRQSVNIEQLLGRQFQRQRDAGNGPQGQVGRRIENGNYILNCRRALSTLTVRSARQLYQSLPNITR